MRHIGRCFALALCLPIAALRAQDTSALAPGARVRVRPISGTCEFTGPSCVYRWVVGTLDSINSVTIALHDEQGTPVSLPRGPNTRLDVSTGPGSCSENRGNCVFGGFLLGAGVGALAGAIWVKTQGSGCNDNPCGLIYLLTMPAGALVGTIVGASVGGEHWQQVGPVLRVGLRPTGHQGLALSVSVPF